jgi:hypothetical protein
MLAVAIALASLTSGAQERIVFVPLEAQGVSWEAARSASDQLVSVLRRIDGITVLSTKELVTEIGVDLETQAQACRRELFCLVQIGEAAGARRIVVGDLARGKSDVDTLKLQLIDVDKSAVIETLAWKIPARSGALEDALPAAARQLVSKPDAKVVFAIDPRGAELRIYGERVDLPQGEVVPFWSGVYYAEVSKKGFESQQLRIIVPKGGPTRIDVKLEGDPLYVHTERQAGPPITASAEAVPKAVERPSPFANWVAWGIVAAGAAAGAAGGLIMSGAQSDYNAVSGEARYTEDATLDAGTARQIREDARSKHGTGSIVLAAGAIVAAGGIAWMVIDAMISGGR